MATQIASAALQTTATLTCKARGGKTQATAAISAEFELVPYAYFRDIKLGRIEKHGQFGDGYVRPISQGRWAEFSGRKWSDMGRWIQNPVLPIVWTSNKIDVGTIKYFTLSITSEFNGSISYLIWTSDTGEFDGEERQYLIEEGNTDIPAFYGRYLYVQARVTGNLLRRMTIETNSSTFDFQLQNVDTSTLSGTVGNRSFSLPTPISAIQDISISVKAATPYAVNLYVSDTATSEVLIPVVRSKVGTSPSFGLFGIDNDPRDGIVDVKIKAMNRQSMVGGNVYIIEQ